MVEKPGQMTFPRSLIYMANRFAPEALELAFQRMYAGVRFFEKHALRPEYNLGHVRLALDIVKALRPEEPLSGDEERLLHNLDPRTFKAAVENGIQQSPESDVSTKFLTVKQLARALSVSLPILYGMIRKGEIPYIQAGRKCFRFDPQSIQRWKEQRAADHLKINNQIQHETHP